MMFVSTYGRGYIYEATNTPIPPFGVCVWVGGWVGEWVGGWWLGGGGGGDRPHIWLLGGFKTPRTSIMADSRCRCGSGHADRNSRCACGQLPRSCNISAGEQAECEAATNATGSESAEASGALGVQRPTSVVVGPAKLAPAATSMPRVAPCASNQALAGAGAAAAARTGEPPASRLPTHRE